MFNPAEMAACQRLVQWALAEDADAEGDRTSLALIPDDLTGRGILVARSPGVLAGLPVVAVVVKSVDPRLTLRPRQSDGAALHAGDQVAVLSGPVRSLLRAERPLLNFLQHLSGIATLTRRYVDALAGLHTQILDTRKTLPGWRLLAKYAVRQGGGFNHRLGLSDGVLIKDNHLAALAGEPGAISRAVQTVRQRYGNSLPLEIEVETLTELDEALDCAPDIVLLDNMTLDELREAVTRRNLKALAVLLEASGGINLQTVRAIAETGVDRISVGALTHSAPALDIALDFTEG
jgi:nicotinate-nucleotide pyrophosphorylase (carboxylating)